MDRVVLLLLMIALGRPALAQNADDPPARKESARAVDPFDPAFRRGRDGADADRKLLQEHGIEPTEEGLLAFFRKRTLPEEDRGRVAVLVEHLAAADYRKREQAMEELVRRGPSVLDFLRRAAQGEDLEMVRRAEQCIARIRSADLVADVPAAAVRVLAQLPSGGTAKALLGFLPYADSEYVSDEVRAVLNKQATRPEGPPADLAAALKDPLPARRGAAAEALAWSPGHADAVRELLKDPDASVRLRAAQGLIAAAREKAAVPVLIEAIPLVSNLQAWPAEDLLLRIAEGKAPPMIARGADAESHKKYRAAWLAWWAANEKATELARLGKQPALLGHTVVVLLDQGQILELNAENQVVWQIDGLVFPLDVQVLPNGNVLVAEYNGGRVTERDRRGEVRWEKAITGPLMAQRLPNRHTFVATDTQLFQFDEKGNEVFAYTAPGSERFMKVAKLPNGEIAALTSDARVVRLDEKGKELHSFTIGLQSRLFGGRIHMLPNGRVLVPLNGENKVVEYDAQGQPVWEVSVPQPVAAVRLANGNTLVTTMQPQTGALEYDRNGREVWQYRHTTRVTRALRR